MAEQITNYQCPACTGPLHYSESLGKLKCDYCGTEYEVAEIEGVRPVPDRCIIRKALAS